LRSRSLSDAANPLQAYRPSPASAGLFFAPNSFVVRLAEQAQYQLMPRQKAQKRSSAFPNKEVIAKAEGRFSKADKERAGIKRDPEKAVTRARARVRGFNR
jgi:hypothetical protein